MNRIEQRELLYNRNNWEEMVAKPSRTLQLFITDKCNQQPRCKECFYQDRLGVDQMSWEEYIGLVDKYVDTIDKVILLGGEPTLHPLLHEFVDYNTKKDLRTTIYTNGLKLRSLIGMDFSNVTTRIGVHGVTSIDKPLQQIEIVPEVPVAIVYMLRRDNFFELMEAARMAELFNCEDFFISSIRNIRVTRDYWIDTEDTLPLDQYFDIVQDFISRYQGDIKKIHIARRGVILTEGSQVDSCRFGNIFPDGKMVICPFDISKKIYSDELFKERPCNKHSSCLLQKMILVRK